MQAPTLLFGGRMKLVPLALLTATAVVAVDARRADACSPPPCWPGFFTPGTSAHVPANLPAIHWQPMRTFDTTTTADPSKVTLKTQAGATIALTATAQADGSFLLVPATELSPNETYVLEDGNTCMTTGETGPTSTFATTAAAPLPTQLGSLLAMESNVGPLEVGTAAGSCSSVVQADTASVVVEHAADATPWRDVLFYETLVDGQRWSASNSINASNAPGTSWRGRGTDRVYRVCETDDATVGERLSEGPHVIAMRATLPGSPTAIATSEVTIELSCSDPPPPDGEEPGEGDGGCSTTRAGGLAIGFAALFARRRRRR